MEKYIIIFVILVTIYYIQQKLKETEGFENVPTQSLGGVDDTNAINTLAQIAKQLMTGGITIPGAITIQGDLTFPEANTIVGKKRLHIGGEELLYILNKAGVMIGKEWGGNGNLTVQGDATVNANLGVGGSINVGGDINFLGPKTILGKARLHIGGEELLYILNKAGVIVGKEWGGNGNLTVQGNIGVNGDFIRTNPIYRKHDIAGYFHIRAYGWRTPLYYGFNMMWNDHNIKEAVRRKWGWNESMFSNTIHDMRQHNDPNWTARCLIVFPGYKVNMYDWDGSFRETHGKAFVAGEHGPFLDGMPLVHGIFVSLAEEGDAPARINW
jgi:hypothetical protein